MARRQVSVVAGIVPGQDFRLHGLFIEGAHELHGLERLLGIERDVLAALVAFGGAVAPQYAAIGDVRVDRMPEPDANRVALGLELGSADAEVLPGVRVHPDLVPQVLPVEARDADVEGGESAPGLQALVIADLAADLV